MKKLLLLFVTACLTVSCSSDDGDSGSSPNNQNKITPPAWIQGEWKGEGDPHSKFRFTSNDFCQLSTIQDFCWKSIVDQGSAIPNPSNQQIIYQEISNTRYLLVMQSTGSNLKMEFQKKSENEIIWLSDPLYVEGVTERTIYVRQ